MRKTILILVAVLFLINIHALANETEYFEVLDKRPEVRNRETHYVLVLVKSSASRSAYRDIDKYPRIPVETTRWAYDNVLVNQTYTLQELVYLGVTEIPAEQTEGKQAHKTMIKEPSELQEKAKQKAKQELFEKADSITKFMNSIVGQDGLVKQLDLEELQDKADIFLKRKNRLVRKDVLTQEEIADLEQEVAIAENLDKQLERYFDSSRKADNRKGELKQIFEQVTGRDDIQIEKTMDWWSAILFSLFLGCLFGGLIGAASYEQTCSKLKGFIIGFVVFIICTGLGFLACLS